MTTIVRATSGLSLTFISINRPLVFYFSDNFNPTIITDLEAKYGKPDIVISDVEGNIKDIGYPFYFIPALDMGLLSCIDKIKNLKLSAVFDDTNCCFCWSINRKHIDRYLVIRLIEFLGFEKFRYTWSGVDRRADCTLLIDEMQKLSAPWLTTELKSHILKPIQLEKRYKHAPDAHNTNSNVQLPFGGLEFAAQVQQELSQECAVYVLTESTTSNYQHYTFTEKTLWCLLNGCFPIWAGNFAQAEMAERMGIDVFHDVIDHSYQYKETLLERCWYAIHDNVKILSSLSLARDMREMHKQRLQKNREWLLKGGLASFVNRQWAELNQLGIHREDFFKKPKT